MTAGADSETAIRPHDNDSFRPDIEGLRGVAVSLVVIFHVGLLSASGWQLPGGFIGVDLLSR